MSTSLPTMIRLRAIQNKTRQLLESLNDKISRTQFHPDLSPLGWHLGHCLYIENYWLHEVLQSDNRLTAKLERLYIPENCPKPQRGKRIPKLKQLVQDAQQQQDNNDLLLIEMTPPLSQHKLLQDEYLQYFIIQHYAQHFETMQMVLNQMSISQDRGKYTPTQRLQATPLSTDSVQINAGEFEIGGESPLAYDNELPKQQIRLDSFNIALRPVTNAEYIDFIQAGSYDNPQYWSDEAWQWLTEHHIRQPDHWRQNKAGHWYGIEYPEPVELVAGDPVYGISHYEAEAFARWSNARLPHEHEWEASVIQGKLEFTGKVWEWCSNTFFPYQGFEAFPYQGYSKPWFDDGHFVVRGASRHTRPEIRRPSFRNFFNPDKRHTFAGLRLVFD
ncbi:MAG: SUMF1/EgtB/PvdO family nonheme iron enzyme [Gammaproteobacteria bacterium]|nr:SUMF1/EgtB/PvdO family nonheme iron enzyme [Gammaproteobacteria bacterium]